MVLLRGRHKDKNCNAQTSRKNVVSHFFDIMVFFSYQQSYGSTYISKYIKPFEIQFMIKKLIKNFSHMKV